MGRLELTSNSGNSNYANKTPVNSSKLNTGKAGDEVLHIHDMASNCYEWSTEHLAEAKYPCVGMCINIDICSKCKHFFTNRRTYIF